MAKVYVGYGEYGLEGMDDEYIRFIFDIAVGVAKLNPDSEVGLVITSDEQMQKMNARYRGKDKTTNVLSFAYAETSDDDFVAKGDENYLGDIYMSRALIASEAKDLEISEQERFLQLFVHGILHLAGMDHEGDEDAEAMEALEDQIIAKVLE